MARWLGVLVVFALTLPALAQEKPGIQKFLASAAKKRKAGNYRGAISDCSRALAKNPESVDAHIERGWNRVLVGDIRGGLADYDKAVALDPSNPEAYAHRGWAYLRAGSLGSGQADLRKAVELNPKDDKSYTNLVVALRDSKDLKGAREVADAFVTALPESAAARALRSEILQLQGDIEGALTELSQAARMTPGSPEYLLRRASVLYGRRRFEEARTDLKRALKRDPGNGDALGLLGNIEIGLDNLDAAIKIFEELEVREPGKNRTGVWCSGLALLKGDVKRALEFTNSGAPDAEGQRQLMFNRGLAQLASGDTEKAAATLKDFLAGKSTAPALVSLGVALGKLGNANGARRCFERALSSFSSSYAPALRNLAISKALAGDLAGARAAVGRATEIDLADPANRALKETLKANGKITAADHSLTLEPYLPAQHAAVLDRVARAIKEGRASAKDYRDRAQIRYETKKFELFREDLRAAMTLDPKDADAPCRLGLATFQVFQNVEGALKLIRRAIELNPTYARAHFELAYVISNSSTDLDAAIAAYKSALTLDPDYVSAYFNLGHIHRFRRNWREALSRSPKVFTIGWPASLRSIHENRATP